MLCEKKNSCTVLSLIYQKNPLTKRTRAVLKIDPVTTENSIAHTCFPQVQTTFTTETTALPTNPVSAMHCAALFTRLDLCNRATKERLLRLILLFLVGAYCTHVVDVKLIIFHPLCAGCWISINIFGRSQNSLSLSLVSRLNHCINQKRVYLTFYRSHCTHYFNFTSNSPTLGQIICK